MRVCPICNKACDMTPVGINAESTGIPGWRCGTWGLDAGTDTARVGFKYISGMYFIKINSREVFEKFMIDPEKIVSRNKSPLMVYGQ